MSESSLLVRGGTLVTMDPQRRILDGDVWIVDGDIAAVGKVPPEAAAARVIDASGCHVLPGLIQAHVHLGQAMFRGLAEGRALLEWLRERIWPLEVAHDRDSAYWSGMLGAADCMLSGTTTIQDIGLVTHMDGIFESIADSGLRGIAGKCLMDVGVGVPPGLVEPAKASLAESRALHETWHGARGGRIHNSLCPRFILSCSAQLWEGTAELAAELGIPVHTHLLEHPREEEEVVEVLGVGQMEFLDQVGILDTDLRIAHGVQFEARHRDILAGRSLRIAHCPSANLKLGSGIADLVYLGATPGVSVGIGTDGAPCNNDMDILEEVRLAALLQGYKQGPGRYGARQALELATIGGAEALGMADRIGSLEVGKAGDLVVLDLDRPATFGPHQVEAYDRIVYGAGRDAVREVVVAGDVLVHGGRLVAQDEQEIQRKAGEAVGRLIGRAGL